jgi:SAM-dependent methyltransferase
MTDDSNKRLSTPEYWEKWFAESPTIELPDASAAKEMSGKKKLLLRLLGQRTYSSLRNNYSASLLWDVIYPTYLPRRSGLKFLELGSAPGTNLVRMKSDFHYEPFGIEYTKNGVRQNRDLFVRNGIDPNNVIHDDFLSDDVAAKYANSFDIVYSGGLIEHFTNVDEVISRHIDLLAPGGVLVVGIPNLRGMNYALTKIVNGAILDVHNLSIMDKGVFCSLFERPSLEPLYCDYYGTINLPLFFTDNRYFKNIVDRGFGTVQLLLNLLLNRVLMAKSRRFESKYTSPYLIYIGRKRGSHSDDAEVAPSAAAESFSR